MANIYKATQPKTNSEASSAQQPSHHHRNPTEYSEVIRTTSPTTNPLAAFMIQPSGVRFETQESEEKVLLLLRKDFVTNLGWITLVILFSLLPLGIISLLNINGVPSNYVFMGILIWYLLVFGFAFEAFLSWYFNVYIVTDERVIDYDFYSLLYKRVSAAKIADIQDVTYVMGGIASSVFNYGNVLIQTAGENLEIDFEAVPNPEKVVRLLNELILEEEREELEGRVR